MMEWRNDAGWRVVLSVRDGSGANLSLYPPESAMPVFYRQYQWWECYRARAEADGLVQLGGLQEVARVRGA